MSEFIKFSEIDLNHLESWKGKKIISFDIDWTIDEVILDVIELVEQFDVKCTFFVTHDTPVLKRLRTNENIQLGIHPNFNPLIDSQDEANTARRTLEKLMEIVPEATVIRSHSMTHSARWLSMYKEFGLTHLSQYYMGGVETIQPFKHVNGLIETPVYFADDGYVFVQDHKEWKNDSIDKILGDAKYIKVYNFHPIHLSLNTDSFDFYNETRNAHQNWNALLKCVNAGFGARTILKLLMTDNGNR